MNFYLLGFMEDIFFIYGASMVFYVVKRRTHDLKTVYRFTKVAYSMSIDPIVNMYFFQQLTLMLYIYIVL